MTRIRAGVLWPYGHPGISSPESLRGSNLRSILPSVLPATYLQKPSLGFHRFEPVNGTVLPPPRAMLLTRQGISLELFLSNTSRCQVSNSQLLLHVAMQTGLYLHRFITDVWRVVSEDSDDLSTLFTPIHGFGNSNDAQQTFYQEMLVRLHSP